MLNKLHVCREKTPTLSRSFILQEKHNADIGNTDGEPSRLAGYRGCLCLTTGYTPLLELFVTMTPARMILYTPGSAPEYDYCEIEVLPSYLTSRAGGSAASTA